MHSIIYVLLKGIFVTSSTSDLNALAPSIMELSLRYRNDPQMFKLLCLSDVIATKIPYSV